MKNNTTLDQFKDKHFGKRETIKRKKFESGYERFKTDTLLHEAQAAKSLTQEDLANKLP